MRTLILCAMLAALPNVAVALDDSDQGTYAVVHVDGHVTDFLFRLSHSGEGWMIEQKQSDDRWENVTCEEECVLHESSPAEIAAALGTPPNGKTVQCIQNSAFAFCRVHATSNPAERTYVLVTFVNGEVHSLPLQPVTKR